MGNAGSLLPGKWKGVARLGGSSKVLTLSLGADGRYTLTAPAPHASEGTWLWTQDEGNTGDITLTSSNSTATEVKFEILDQHGTQMKVKGGPFGSDGVLLKKEAEQAPPSGSAPSPTITNEDVADMVRRARTRGAGGSEQQPGSASTWVKNPAGTKPALTIAEDDIQDMIRRAGGSGSGGTGAALGGATAAGNAGPLLSNSQATASLAGRWVTMDSYQSDYSGSGGYSSTESFTLASDGRFAWRSEFISSVYVPGLSGSSVRSDSDQGTWSMLSAFGDARNSSGAIMLQSATKGSRVEQYQLSVSGGDVVLVLSRKRYYKNGPA